LCSAPAERRNGVYGFVYAERFVLSEDDEGENESRWVGKKVVDGVYTKLWLYGRRLPYD